MAKTLRELILLDTSANESFSCNLRWIYNLKYFLKPQYAVVGDRLKYMAYGIGYWLLPTSNGRIKPFPAEYAPSLPNMFSCEHAATRLKLLTGYSIHQTFEKICLDSTHDHVKDISISTLLKLIACFTSKKRQSRWLQ